MRTHQVKPVYRHRLFRNQERYSAGIARRVLTASSVLITFTVLGFLLVRDWNTLRQFQWHFRPLLFILALFAHAVSVGGTFVAWKLITGYLGSPTSARTDFQIYFLSLTARKLPSAIWYVGTRVFLYSQERVGPPIILSAVAMEFIIAILTGGWVFVAFQSRYLFMVGNMWIGHILVIVTLFLTLLFLIKPHLAINLIQRSATKHNSVPLAILPKWHILAICFVIYLIAWIIGGTSFYLIVWALIPDPKMDWFNAVGIATLSTLAVLVCTVLPMGIGLKELTASALLAPWMPITVGLSVSVVYRLLQTLDEALWIGLAYFLHLSSQVRESAKRGDLALDNPNEVLR